MKKYLSLILVILLAFSFASCSSKSSNTEEISTTKTSSSVLNEETSLSAKEEASKSKETTKSTTKKSTFEKLNDAFSGTTKSTTKKVEATKKNQTTKSATKKSTTSKPTSYCTITVECKEILTHKNNLADNHEKYVPSNGYLIDSYNVSISGETSVYDVLKTACEHYNYRINSENSTYGIYIKGINQIDEKDCGSQSGWMYMVNSKYPSFSADKVKVSKGDKIVFHYQCEYK